MATATGNTTATTWTLDASHSTVGFAVKHMMITNVRGSFGGVSGSVSLEGDEYRTAIIEADIDATSITTGNDQRDGHLRSADFFDVESFDKLTFRSTRVTAGSDDDLKVVGDLTIRGTTRPVTLDVTIEGTGVDPWGSQRLAFTATTKIRRSEFGLTWNQALETGGVVVSDEIRITIDGVLVRQ